MRSTKTQLAPCRTRVLQTSDHSQSSRGQVGVWQQARSNGADAASAEGACGVAGPRVCERLCAYVTTRSREPETKRRVGIRPLGHLCARRPLVACPAAASPVDARAVRALSAALLPRAHAANAGHIHRRAIPLASTRSVGAKPPADIADAAAIRLALAVSRTTAVVLTALSSVASQA